HLVSALAEQVSKLRPSVLIGHLSADDFRVSGTESGMSPEENSQENTTEYEESQTLFSQALQNDFLIVEDLQHLPPGAVTAFVQMMDNMHADGKQMIFTGNAGPRELQQRKGPFPARFLSRLGAGTAIHLEPLQFQGRKLLLETFCQNI